MKKYYVILSVLLLAVISCNKDEITSKKPLEKYPEWDAKQNVRILKVEVKTHFWAVPFENTGDVMVQYSYDTKGVIQKISVSFPNNPNFYIHNWDAVSNEYKMSGFEYPVPNSFFILRDNEYDFSQNMLTKIRGDYGTWLPTIGILNGNYYRNVDFEYSDNGLLTSIHSNFEYIESSDFDTTNYITYHSEFAKIQYVKNDVATFHFQGRSYAIYYGETEYENFDVYANYDFNNDLPDGLTRMVNQAILGLSSIGMEEALVNPEFVNDSIRYASDTSTSSSVFVDWIYSFACPRIQTIPAQNIGLISHKRIVGKRMSYIDDNVDNPKTIFTNVDSTATFPYTHDAQNKTLDIAGLKIWYELVE